MGYIVRLLSQEELLSENACSDGQETGSPPLTPSAKEDQSQGS